MLSQKKIVKTFTVAMRIHQTTFWWLCPCVSLFLGIKNGVSLACRSLKCLQYISPPAGIMRSGDWGYIYHYFWILALFTLNILAMISQESKKHSEVIFSLNINEKESWRKQCCVKIIGYVKGTPLICTCAPVAGIDIILCLENIKTWPIGAIYPASSLASKRLIL